MDPFCRKSNETYDFLQGWISLKSWDSITLIRKTPLHRISYLLPVVVFLSPDLSELLMFHSIHHRVFYVYKTNFQISLVIISPQICVKVMPDGGFFIVCDTVRSADFTESDSIACSFIVSLSKKLLRECGSKLSWPLNVTHQLMHFQYNNILV